MSKTLRNWQDLGQFGIYSLTREACEVNRRMLCDIDSNGKALLENMLGAELTMHNSVNNGVGSILLPTELWQSIATFALLRAGYDYVVEFKDGAIVGIWELEYDRHIVQNSDRNLKIERITKKPNQEARQDKATPYYWFPEID